MTVFMPYAELLGDLPENTWYADHKATLEDGRIGILDGETLEKLATIELPMIELPLPRPPAIATPSQAELPIRFSAAGTVPPMRLLLEPFSTATP